MTTRQRLLSALAITVVLHALRLAMPAFASGCVGFSPVFAAAMFSGAAFGLAPGLLLTLALTTAGDLLTQHFVFHDVHGFPIYPGWEWVYASFAVAVLAGVALRDGRFSRKKFAGLSLAVILVHWLLADLGIWTAGGCGADCVREYTRDLSGFVAVMRGAVSTEIRLLAATLAFGGAAFALDALVLKKIRSGETVVSEN